MGPRDQQQPQESWKPYDLNGDGKITRGEFMAVRAVCFAKYDANGYGMLTREEVRKFSPRLSADRIEAAFSRLDVDRDGQISREEFEQGSHRLFRQLDTNGDGIIAGMELGNLGSALLGDICQSPGAPEPGEGRPWPGRGGAGPGDRR
jgi:Ca2+-binding EF-hand superfamily protein